MLTGNRMEDSTFMESLYLAAAHIIMPACRHSCIVCADRVITDAPAGAEAGVANDLLLFQAPDGEECLVGKGNRIVAGVNNCARWFFLIPSIVFYTVIFHFYGEP